MRFFFHNNEKKTTTIHERRMIACMILITVQFARLNARLCVYLLLRVVSLIDIVVLFLPLYTYVYLCMCIRMKWSRFKYYDSFKMANKLELAPPMFDRLIRRLAQFYYIFYDNIQRNKKADRKREREIIVINNNINNIKKK